MRLLKYNQFHFLVFIRTGYVVCFKMASLDDDDVIDEENLECLLEFPPEVQEAIDQVFHFQ